ncbi:site-specific recombinase xerd [Haloferax volcanii DSM 14919]|uniref:Site-specific recombinase xerd n=1 Tax=Haloferax lucentense (strain DSM 14919 / JCM 9276 / NCIMB 13854 / Aa 2.2) TaxID=1230452 RepID=M0GPX9_HALL2|nr:tyrosine-type recombinase/integrase [Haloferax lucentense]ELZ73542.1 site-specific recombinase xerd [Haloferax lucentense DSM 14919]
MSQANIEAFKRRVRAKNSDGTANRYASAIRRYVAWLDSEGLSIEDADRWDIENHLLELAEGEFAEGTIKIAKASIEKYYKELHDTEGITEGISLSQWSNIKGTKKSKALGDDVHYLEPEQIQQLVDNVPSPKLRNQLLIKLAFQTGLRRGELTTIKLRDVNREERSIKIHADKTHNNRTVYYQPSLDTSLSLWIDVERNAVLTADSSPYLFPTQKRENLLPKSYGKIVRIAAENAGIQEVLYEDNGGRPIRKITSHSLRHSFAVACLRNNMDVRTLQKLMGHENIETTERYLDIADEDIKQKARQFGPSLES